jgi:hypothetical protein
MKLRVITIATVVHLVLAAIMWFFSLGVALGYGFKDKLNAIESFLSVVVPFLTKTLAAPAWFIYSSNEPWLKNIPSVLVVALLVVNSFLQVNILLFAYNMLKAKLQHNKSSEPSR